MPEEWRDIPGYEKLYQVSNFGRVKSISKCWSIGKNQTCVEERIMSLQVHYRGYLQVHLRRPGEHKKFFVHRLVAMAFLPNPKNKEVVNHRDRNITHNCVAPCERAGCVESNLEWATYSENTQHYMAMDRAAAEGADIPF